MWNFGNGGMEKIVSSLINEDSNDITSSLLIINKENDINSLKTIDKKNVSFVNRKKGSKNFFKFLILLTKIVNYKPDIIHIHYFDLIKILKPLQNIIKFKIILTIHGMNDFDHKILDCDKVITVSKNQYNFVKKKLKNKGLKTEKLKMIYNGIQIPKKINKRNIDLNNLNLVCLGRLNHNQKRQDIILKYFSRLKEKYPNSNLSFYGSGDSLEYLKNIVKSLNISKNINFEGSVENNILLKELTNYSVMISASKEETFGLNIIEALSIGLPILAYPAKSIKEISNNNPIVFYFKDENSFIEVIEKEIKKISIEDKKYSRTLIRESYNLNYMINQYFEIYNKLK